MNARGLSKNVVSFLQKKVRGDRYGDVNEHCRKWRRDASSFGRGVKGKTHRNRESIFATTKSWIFGYVDIRFLVLRGL